MISSFSDRFTELNQLLCHYHYFWQLSAFEPLALPWWESASPLCYWLTALDDAQVEAIKNDPARLASELTQFIPDAPRLAELSMLPELPLTESAEPPARFSNHIKGRKWEQISAFSRVAHSSKKLDTLEWCAGKGHLGRLLGWREGCAVTSVEWQAALCDEGAALVQNQNVAQTFVQADVLKGEADQLLSTHQRAVALHACGELHLHLLREGAERGVKELMVAPCCYHLIPHDHYQPLSAAAQASGLSLLGRDLQLPLQESVVAGERVRRLRELERQWRLGFDLLQRELRGIDGYLCVPSVAKQIFSGEFEQFVQWAAEQKGLTLNGDIDYHHYLNMGRERVRLLDRIELVQQLFRRPLEIWLNLDRALFLTEAGFEVEMGTFCSYQLTPRNIMLQARR